MNSKSTGRIKVESQRVGIGSNTMLCSERNPREQTVPLWARSASPALRHLDLFSGIGGFALAARWTGAIETVGFCEREPYAQKVLKKHWPDVPICDDIHNLKGNEYGTIDLITGGFPCQPYSVAGERRGNEDDRAIWPEMLRVIREARPTWVIGENVPGIITLALDGVLADMEAEGYACETLCIPACGVDAGHRRERIWIVGNSEGARIQRVGASGKQISLAHAGKEISVRPSSSMADSASREDDGRNEEAWQKRKSEGKVSTPPLSLAVKMWPTPTKSDYRSPNMNPAKNGQVEPASGHALPARVGGQLNPTWVEWLMGYPLGWTDLKVSETP